MPKYTGRVQSALAMMSSTINCDLFSELPFSVISSCFTILSASSGFTTPFATTFAESTGMIIFLVGT